MAEIRHCDRAGCSETEPVSGTWFLAMSRSYGSASLLRFCSWGCLAGEAVERHVRERERDARVAADRATWLAGPPQTPAAVDPYGDSHAEKVPDERA